MKIQYDHQIFTNQEYGGISRYFYELIKRFDGIENSCDVSTLFSNNAYYNKSTNYRIKSFFPNNNFKGKSRIIRFVNQSISNSIIEKGKYDVFHPTYYDNYFLDKIKQKPFIVTFYDLIHEKFLSRFEYLKLDDKIHENKRRLLDRSKKIIAISETTKKDIVELFDVDSKKIEVIYLGNSLENADNANSRIVEEDYILFIGNRYGYKNFDFLLSSITELLIRFSLKLVCAGGGAFTKQELDLFRVLNVEKHVVYRKITDDQVLTNYYTNAMFFVFPSLYEGFGIPVLESFACSCATLLSNAGSLPEIGGEASEYFDPNDSQSIYNSVYKLINNSSLREKLIEIGTVRLRSFSWNDTFSRTIEVYKSVL